MIINLKIKEDRVIGYRTFPIDLNIEYVEVDEIPLDILSGRYTYKNHKIDYTSNSCYCKDTTKNRREPIKI